MKPILEDKARIARYGAFAEIMNKQTTLVTGHHIDDQVETLFLNLMRGAGLDGLSAMPSIKTFSSGFHSRPFLNISKEDLKAYAIENNISWVEDESNNDSVYDRNFIRNEVMPLIKTRSPYLYWRWSQFSCKCCPNRNLYISMV